MWHRPIIKLSLDKKHVWIGGFCCDFETAKGKAHKILDLVNGQEDEQEIKEQERLTKGA